MKKKAIASHGGYGLSYLLLALFTMFSMTSSAFALVNTETTRMKYACSGGTAYTYSFPIQNSDDLRVIKADSAGSETLLTLTTDYAVSGVGSVSGGTVTLVSACASGYTLTILRDHSFTQDTDLIEGDAFPVDTVEGAFDKLTMQDLELKEELSRAIRVPGNSAVNGASLETIPVANRSLCWDNSGTAITTCSTTAVNANAELDSLANYSGSLATAVTAIGSGNVQLICDTATTISTAVVIPATMVLEARKGCMMTKSGTGSITFATQASLITGQFKIFSGFDTGISFTTATVVRPEWWGAVADGSADSTTSIQAALNTKADVQLLRGTYKITDTISYAATVDTTRQKLMGVNETETVIAWYGSGAKYMVNMHYGGTEMYHLMLNGRNVASVNGISMANVSNTFFQVFRNVYIINIAGGIGFDAAGAGGGFANENSYYDIHVTGAAYGFNAVGPDHTLWNSVFASCTVFGMNAAANAKVIMHSVTFTDNAQDLQLSSASEVSCYSCWFENSTGADAPIALYGAATFKIASFYDCHFHTYTSGSYFIDFHLAASGAGTLILKGNYFVTDTADPSTTADLYLATTILADIKANKNLGTVTNLYSTSSVMSSTALSPEIGLSGVYGAAEPVVFPNGFATAVPYHIKLVAGGSFAGGETVTVAIYTYGSDYIGSALVEVALSGTGTTWLTSAQMASLWLDGTAVRAINAFAKTSAGSTSVTLAVTPYIVGF